MLVRNDGLPIRDFFEESIRVRQAHIDLLLLQINELKDKQREEKKEKQGREKTRALEKKNKSRRETSEVIGDQIGNELEVEPAKPREEEVVKEQFHLSDWELYTTETYWSSDPKDHIVLPTDSREELIKAYAKVANGTISIPAKSVIRALEFCVQNQTVLSKSLDTRLKYGNLKDWIRLKRGSDRVGILIPDPDKKVAVFFAGPRSRVYEAA